MDRSKHMNAFVERELMKKRGQSLDSPVDGESSSPQTQNPTDELFDIPENLRVKDSALPEGNVTLSASMLTAIPEIDLGIDIKLKNIAETEQAKQKLSGRKHTKKDLLDYSQNVTAAERFMTARYHQQQRSDHSQQHGRNSNHGNSDNHSRSQGSESRGHRSDRRSMATDDIVMERFKKRMRR
ncbi:hepatocellular carcinoma-associated antigen 59-domain-containing protein [Polychytrium aggregatum]|uniref:hepatocellular carcinoma-associated antigen 59-domain-containing protein n=1 Tax=Polychytrium aggregatum TaxID=110093 RepID=UPI0022FE8A3C|nr:hepatocellular carcinoma-associated antigen 59-domain-containing protein [Polychytrium aggregatum]KAI9208503.1 hepatocellular carcinoma-associated antigen 59-domain-containing protein [Polychytrium aggregatum]